MDPSICKCCGEPLQIRGGAEEDNPNVCAVCASLFDDVQDNMIIESAIPYELDAPPPSAEASNPDEDDSAGKSDASVPHRKQRS